MPGLQPGPSKLLHGEASLGAFGLHEVDSGFSQLGIMVYISLMTVDSTKWPALTAATVFTCS